MWFIVETNSKLDRRVIHGPYHTFEDAAFFAGVKFVHRSCTYSQVTRIEHTNTWTDGKYMSWTIYYEGVL